MRIGIDKAGRVVLPKAVRDHYGVNPGAVLEVEESDEIIVLRPIHDEPSVGEKNGLLVVSSPADEDLADSVSRMREGRLDSIASAASKDRRP